METFPRRFIFILTAALLLPFHSAVADDPKKDAQVGLADMKEGTDYVIFTGKINGHSATIGLDTGSYSSFIYTPFVKEIGLSGRNTTVTLSLGNFTLENLSVNATDFKKILTPFRAAGCHVVLGHNFVLRTLLVCDYPKRKVALVASESKKGYGAFRDIVIEQTGKSKEETAVDIVFVDDHSLVKAKVNKTIDDVYFGVDTGGSGQVNTMSQVGMNIFNLGQKVNLDIEMGGRTFKEVSFLKWAPCGLDEYAVGVQKNKKIVFAGVLGYAFIKNYKVIFDYNDKKIVFCTPDQ